MLIRFNPVTLSFDLESSWYIKHHVIKILTKFEWNRAIPGRIIDNFGNFCTDYVTLWPDLLTLNFYSTSQVMRLNSVQNLSEIKWSTAELWQYSMFCPAVFWGGAQLTESSHGCVDTTSPNWVRTYSGHRGIALLFQSSDILLHFSNAGGSNLSDVENCAKFRTFWPLLPVKSRGGWTRSLYQLLKLYLRNTFDGHQLRFCWMQCIGKNK